MEHGDIDAVVTGFAAGRQAAARSGCDGVEINAGQHSLWSVLSGHKHRNTSGAAIDAFAREVSRCPSTIAVVACACRATSLPRGLGHPRMAATARTGSAALLSGVVEADLSWRDPTRIHEQPVSHDLADR